MFLLKDCSPYQHIDIALNKMDNIWEFFLSRTAIFLIIGLKLIFSPKKYHYYCWLTKRVEQTSTVVKTLSLTSQSCKIVFVTWVIVRKTCRIVVYKRKWFDFFSRAWTWGFFYRLPARCYYLIHVQRRVVFKNNTTQCNFKTFCRWILGVFIHPVLIFFFNNVSFDIEFIVLQKLMYLRSTILWYLIIIISASSEQKNVTKRVNAYPYPYKN